MVIEPQPHSVGLGIGQQVPTVTISYWLVSRMYHVEVGVGLLVCHSVGVLGPIWSSPVPVCCAHVDPIYLIIGVAYFVKQHLDYA